MTITRGFGFSLNAQTGETTRWAAGDPASVAEHLDAARDRMRAANVPTLDQIRGRMGPMAGAEVLGKVTGHPPGMLQDGSRELSAWLSSKPDAMMHARDAVAAICASTQPTPCAVCCVGHVTLQHDDAGYYRSCEACGSDYAGVAELALNRRPCRCGPDGCSDSACAGKAP